MPTDNLKDRNQSDSAQGGEGTNSFDGKGYDPMLKSVNEGRGVDADKGHERTPDIDQGTA